MTKKILLAKDIESFESTSLATAFGGAVNAPLLDGLVTDCPDAAGPYCCGCSYCTACTECSNCSDCTNCSDCSNCSECSSCSSCSSCSTCSSCTECTNCTNCTCADAVSMCGCLACSQGTLNDIVVQRTA